MAKNLVIVESPAKARTVGRFLGADYDVKASLGHVRDLPSNKLGVEVDNDFTPSYIVPKDKIKVVKDLKKASKNASNIYIATDPDREGEAISWHLIQAAGWENRSTQRVVFHQITDEAIQDAFRNPREIDMRLVNAQQARRVLDRLVGYQLSPLLWRKVQRGLSAGRVQSVALRIVVDRERDIEAFTTREYWVISATLRRLGRNNEDQQAGNFNTKLQRVLGERKSLKISSEDDARTITSALEGASYSVVDLQKKEVRNRPAPPFITSTLQQEAWRKLRFSAKKTMSLAQQLYEGLSVGEEGSIGLITYMRTDSTDVAPSALREAIEYIRANYGAKYAPKSPRSYTKKSKGAQEAHEAIRPTSIKRTPELIKNHLSRDQARLYDLIWKRMLASQMVDAVSDSTRVDVHAQGPNTLGQTYVFRTTGIVLKFPGFRAVYLEDRDDSEEDEDQSILPELTVGELLNCLGVAADQRFTQPPPRYTDATLIRKLEEEGIGRPSTYAPTLSTILDRNYILKEQGRFIPTQLGKVVCDQLTNHFPSIMDLGFTATMEQNLDDIASGEKEWMSTLREFHIPFQKALALATEEMPRAKVEEPSEEICDICDRPMVIKTSRFGRFLACTGFPECKGKKPLLKEIGVGCQKCNTGQMVERRGKGRIFYGCTNYPECTFTVSQRPLPEPCPECNEMLVSGGRDRARCTVCSYRGPVPEKEPMEAGV